MTTAADNIFTVASTLRDRVAANLESAGTPVDVAAIYPAAVAWDSCDCGTLAVAVQRQYLTTNFPGISDVDQLPCNSGFVAADLLVQVLRCVPQPQGRDLAPSAEALEATAKLVLSDAWVALGTVQCALAELVEDDVIVQYVTRPQLFAGPDGGCVGSVLSVVVSVEQSSTF